MRMGTYLCECASVWVTAYLIVWNAVRRIEMHFDVFNAFAKASIWTTAVHTMLAMPCCVVLFGALCCVYVVLCVSVSLFFSHSLQFFVHATSVCVCGVCLHMQCMCNAKRFAASWIRSTESVIGRQLCVITFDTHSVSLLRSLSIYCQHSILACVGGEVISVVYRLRFMAHCTDTHEHTNETIKEKLNRTKLSQNQVKRMKKKK